MNKLTLTKEQIDQTVRQYAEKNGGPEYGLCAKSYRDGLMRSGIEIASTATLTTKDLEDDDQARAERSGGKGLQNLLDDKRKAKQLLLKFVQAYGNVLSEKDIDDFLYVKYAGSSITELTCEHPKYYAIGKKVDQVYGHGDYGSEIHVCPKNAYMGDINLHPLFTTSEKAQNYIEGLKFNYDMIPVEMEVLH